MRLPFPPAVVFLTERGGIILSLSLSLSLSPRPTYFITLFSSARFFPLRGNLLARGYKKKSRGRRMSGRVRESCCENNDAFREGIAHKSLWKLIARKRPPPSFFFLLLPPKSTPASLLVPCKPLFRGGYTIFPLTFLLHKFAL